MPIISACAGKYSPPEYNVISQINTDIPLVLVTRFDDYVFNEELRRLNRYVLCDLMEYTWNWDLEKSGTHIWGQNTDKFTQLCDEYKKFDEWVAANPPLITFKRELLQKDKLDSIVPIDYPSYVKPMPIQSKYEFNKRPLNVFHYWGRSHEGRVKAHADFWLQSSKNGAVICDNLYYFDAFLKQENNPNKWATLNIPHYSRIEIQHLIQINGLSKLGLSMAGCGNKCFRHSEVCVNSVMVMENISLSWGYEWIKNVNCIKYDKDPILAIEEALTNPDLYKIYCEGVNNSNNYYIENYTKNYLQPLIDKL